MGGGGIEEIDSAAGEADFVVVEITSGVLVAAESADAALTLQF